MSLGGRHKTGSPDVKTRAPDVCRSSPLGDTRAVECGRGKAGRWLPLAEVKQRVSAKTAPEKKRKEKEKKQRKEKIGKKKKGIKKKRRWFLPGLARQRDSRKMAPTSFHPQRVSQQAPVPQINTLKLADKLLSHKVWALFTGLLLHWALGWVSLCGSPLGAVSQFTRVSRVLWA